MVKRAWGWHSVTLFLLLLSMANPVELLAASGVDSTGAISDIQEWCKNPSNASMALCAPKLLIQPGGGPPAIGAAPVVRTIKLLQRVPSQLCRATPEQCTCPMGSFLAHFVEEAVSGKVSENATCVPVCQRGKLIKKSRDAKGVFHFSCVAPITD